MIADDKVRGASRLPSFHKERKLNFEEFRFVFIDTEYLKYLRGFDPEIFFHPIQTIPKSRIWVF